MKRPISIVLCAAILVAVAACGGPTGGLGSVPTIVPTASPANTDPSGPDQTAAPSDAPASPSPVQSAGPDVTPAPITTPTPTAQPGETMIVRAYFVLGGEPRVDGLVPVLRVVPESAGVARAAMGALLDGPTAAESGDHDISTAIPAGTKLLGVSIRNNVATVDLSTEFDSGGGTASMQYRLAQVVYTLTQFSTIRSVVFQVEGQTVTVFGGEGIVLDGPAKRVDYEDQLPQIFVDRPAFGAAYASSTPVTGSSNVFEATSRIAILDGAGRTLADDMMMATCGTGCRGTFDVRVAYTVTKAQWGTLRVYDPSEVDGSPEAIRDYPVWLTPSR